MNKTNVKVSPSTTHRHDTPNNKRTSSSSE